MYNICKIILERTGVSHSSPTSESTSVPDSSAIRRSTQCGRYRSGNHCGSKKLAFSLKVGLGPM